MQIQIRLHVPRFTKKAKSEYQKTSYRELETRIGYLLWTLEPAFYFSSAGLFLEKLNGNTKKEDYSKLTQVKGKFNAEGLVNHIHLDHIVRNQVWQYEIGLRAIKSWGALLDSIGLNCNAVIYLNESYETSRRANYTLCLYSSPSDSDLKAIESHWKREVNIFTYKQFLDWSKKEYINLL